MHIAYISVSIYYRARERPKLYMTTAELNRYFAGSTTGKHDTTDRRAISNTWTETVLDDGKNNPNQYDDLTTFHFQGAKLERARQTVAATQIFHE